MDTPILGFHLQKRILRGYLKSKNLKKIYKWRLLREEVTQSPSGFKNL
jgi:hypothetical protein